MAARQPAATRPIQAAHLGVLKSKTESATSVQPTVSATCIVKLDPLPSNTCTNTATGRANKRTMEPRNPRGDRMPEPPNVPCCVATLGIVPTPPCSTLRGRSVIPRTSSLPSLREGLARLTKLYGAASGGTLSELPVGGTGFSNAGNPQQPLG